LRGTDNVNTRLENCWCFKNGFRKDGTESTGNGNGFKMGGSDDKNLKHNFTLVRCLAFQNRVKGFDQNNNRGSMTLFNCTAFGNATNYSVDGGSSTLIAKNCIASGNGKNALNGGTQTANNLNAAASNFLSVDPSSAFGPRKADGSLPDITFMHLAPGSSLIDAGEIIEDISFNGNKPDLGCFESGAVTSIGSSGSNNITSKKVHNDAGHFQITTTRTNHILLTLDGRKYTTVFNTIPPASGIFIHADKNNPQRIIFSDTYK
ncbi:MAG TPA: hypothetical protein VHO70_01075, partial [Chitinispirillaceae bacterium]|nr:hypothetical protein [Chitinispirillaceae bacterium]